jgi:hypothetical protein
VNNPEYAQVVADLKHRLDRLQPPQPKRTWLAQCNVPRLALDEEQIASSFGRDDLRLVAFDCTQSWVYPTGGKSPGWVTVAGNSPNRWALQQLDRLHMFAQTNRTGANEPFVLYQDDGRPTWAHNGRVRVAPSEFSLSLAAAATSIDLPVSFQGGLTLLGYTLERTTLKPGDTLAIETAWRVNQVPGQLISLMAHLMGPGEQAFAIGDSLGVPIEYMKRDDVFTQRHTLTLPADAPRGVYWFQTGVYGFENDSRWPVRDARATGNRVLLGPITVEP